MTRYCGQYMKVRNAILIHDLEDQKLYGVAEITATKIDRLANPDLFNRVRSAIWDFGARNGLKDEPDNALRDNHGKVVFKKNGRPKLQKGERWAKLYGHKWKSFLGELEQDTPELIDRLNHALFLRIFALEKDAQHELMPISIIDKTDPETSRLDLLPNLTVTTECNSQGNRFRKLLDITHFTAIAIAAVVGLLIFLFIHFLNGEKPKTEKGKFSAFAQNYDVPFVRRSKITTDIRTLTWESSFEPIGHGGLFAVVNDPPSP